MTALLALRDVLHRYNGSTVLDITELEVASGSITGLTGPNGSGKTTLLKILSFVEQCSSGTVLFEGNASKPFSERTRHRVSLLLQEPYLLKRSVYDNIAYGLRLRGAAEGLAKKVAAALELVGLPNTFCRRLWHELSGGEAQRVALAARLALRPDCLLLDEPTASVDSQSAERIKEAILMARREWGTTIIISSHQRPWLQTICDRIIYMHAGRILPFAPETLLAPPWQSAGDCRKIKTLPDGQIIYLPPSMDSDCAALPPASISIIEEGCEKSYDTVLQGRLTGILEKKNNSAKLNLHVLCGGQLFVLEMPARDAKDLRLQPGQAVKIGFSSDDIVWLPC